MFNVKFLSRSTADSRKFPNDLTIRAVPRWEIYERKETVQLYEVAEPFIYNSEQYGQIEVPVGFMTDFGSVPATAKWFVDDDDPDLLFASLPHDYLYLHKGIIDENLVITRLDADNILRQAMLDLGSPSLKANVVYRAVRAFGGSHWK